MKDLTTTSFGLLIAYLLPGAAGLYAAKLFLPPLKVISDSFFNSTTEIGLFLVVVAAAVVIGLQINALRWFIYENILFKKEKLTSNVDYSRLINENKLQGVIFISEENYRYVQFYGGMTIVLPPIYAGWVHHYFPSFDSFWFWSVSILFVSFSTVTCRYRMKVDVKFSFLFLGAAVLYALFLKFGYDQDQMSVFMLVLSFVLVELVTAAAAHEAQKRYVARTSQIVGGANA